jgi:chromosomal replication initiator protein
MTSNKDPKDFWKKVLAQLQLEVTPMVYGTIISRTALENYSEDKLEIICVDEFIKKTIEKKYAQIIQDAVTNIAQKDIPIKFAIKKAEVHLKNPDEVVPAKSTSGLGPLFTPQATDSPAEKSIKAGLAPKFTFESYITGKSNQLAFAIASTIAERPGEIYNPVFIYSGVGLGKTHLAHAIGNKVIQSKPGAKVIYTTGENFMNEMIDAIQSGKTKGRYTSNDFRNKYRKADVLIIDDIQFIANKDSTQEEFFHTFNALYMAQKQIIITSDKPPKDFTGIEERITSRFNSGMIVDIQPPDFETRVAILRKRRDFNGDLVTNEVIDYIAENVVNNIRELEGAYLRVLTNPLSMDRNITVDSAAEILGKTVKERARKNVNMNQILNAVCTYYAIKSSEIKGKRRNKELVLPRQVAMYLIKEMTNTPFMSIGDFLGGRDHTTVMHGVEKITNEIDAKIKIRQDINNVKQLVYGE